MLLRFTPLLVALIGCHHSASMTQQLTRAKRIESEPVRSDIERLAAIDPEPAGAAMAVACMRRAAYVPRGTGQRVGGRQAEVAAKGLMDTSSHEQLHEDVSSCERLCRRVAENSEYEDVVRSLAARYAQQCRTELQKYAERFEKARTW
jgi:hypothetical protein